MDTKTLCDSLAHLKETLDLASKAFGHEWKSDVTGCYVRLGDGCICTFLERGDGYVGLVGAYTLDDLTNPRNIENWREAAAARDTGDVQREAEGGVDADQEMLDRLKVIRDGADMRIR